MDYAQWCRELSNTCLVVSNDIAKKLDAGLSNLANHVFGEVEMAKINLRIKLAKLEPYDPMSDYVDSI